MTRIPARPEGYGYEYVPAMDSPRGKTEPNWRVSDSRDNRIATCYDEAHCRLIVAALNGAPIVFDPIAVDMVSEQAAKLAEFARRNGGPAGAELAGIAAILSSAADAMREAGRVLERSGGPVELRREGSLESDPYATRGVSFADVLEVSHPVAIDDRGIVVRQRIFDDVHASHRMLDALGIAGGPLTARIGLALGWKVLEREARAQSTRKTPAAPLADADSVKVPDPDRVLELLDRLSGEELFRLFDAVKVLPANTLEARDWNLMDADDTRRMVATCCAIALEAGKLGELAKAAGDMIERAARLK